MRPLLIGIAIAASFGCGSKPSHTAGSPGSPANASPAVPDASPPEMTAQDSTSQDATASASAGCVYETHAARECAARGSGFSYGPTESSFCGGARPTMEEEQADWERIRNSPCVCRDLAALQKQREICSRIP